MADDSRRFEKIVAQLRGQDPGFVTRVEVPHRPSGRRTVALCVLLWMTVPVMIVVGGWTGLLIAVVACGYSVGPFRRARAAPLDGGHRD